MSSSDVSSVVNFFSTANEGFSTTLGSTISAGATTVPLNNTAGLTNGTVFVGIVEPGATAEQVFTGTVDIGSGQISNVVWTRGTNVGHASGVTIVDYVTGTGHNMATAGILKQHTQAGGHKSVTTDTLVVSSGTTLPAGDIGTADLATAVATPDKLATGAQTSSVVTDQATTSTSYADLSTVGPSVTVTIGANGLAFLQVSASMNNNTGGAYCYMSFVASGANTIGANDANALRFIGYATGAIFQGSYGLLLTGLTPGSTTFKAQYKASASTANFSNRNITVIPL